MDVGERKAAKGHFLIESGFFGKQPRDSQKKRRSTEVIGAGVFKEIRNKALCYIILLSFPSLILQLT